MSGTPRHRAAGSLMLAAAVAEGARRLLSPRPRPLKPAPVDLLRFFSPGELERGASFARPQLALALARRALELGVLARLARRLPRPLDRPGRRPVAAGAAVGGLLSVVLTTVTLPLSAISRRRCIAAGLDTQSWRGWAADLVKASGLGAGLAAGAGAGAVAAARRYPRTWWAPAAAGSVGLGALLAAVAPVVLDPLFNDFTPLPMGQTRADVLELAGAAGVKVGQVYSVDASRRTNAANAYVTGLGPTKRVVLYDTLLDRYSRDEVRLVVAHELGHVRYRDVPRSVVYAALVAPALGLAVVRLSWVISPQRGTPGSLPGLALAAAVVGTPVGLIGNRLSRCLERRADQFSLELAGAPEAFVSFERAIALQNVVDLEPPRWVTRLLASHPPTAERIGAAEAFIAAAAGSGRRLTTG